MRPVRSSVLYNEKKKLSKLNHSSRFECISLKHVLVEKIRLQAHAFNAQPPIVSNAPVKICIPLPDLFFS